MGESEFTSQPFSVLQRAAAGESVAHELFHLPAPAETALTTMPLEEIPSLLRLCECCMISVLSAIDTGKLSIEAIESTSDGEAEAPLWSGALCVLGMYHNAGASRIYSEASLGWSFKVAEAPHIRELLDLAKQPGVRQVSSAAYLLARYMQIHMAFGAFHESATSSLVSSICLNLLAFTLSPIGDLATLSHNKLLHPLDGFALLASRDALAYMSSLLKQVSDDAQRAVDRLLSRLSARNLRCLSTRSPEAADQVGGSKYIEIAFEREVSFLMQSFGFYVSPARKGERAVDLVCVNAARDPYTVLLEAKTSRRNYFLPAKDARALREYAAAAREALSTLPEVQLLLIVGPPAARTLSAKLRSLEASIPIPVRYCDISLLDSLRQRLPGPVPAQQFLQALKLAEHVVGEAAIDAIASEYQDLQEAHDQFVRRMLSKGSSLERLLSSPEIDPSCRFQGDQE